MSATSRKRSPLAVAGRARGAERVYELGGPEVKTFCELVDYVLKVTERDRRIAKLSFATGKLVAGVTQLLHQAVARAFPDAPAHDGAIRSSCCRHDNVVQRGRRSARAARYRGSASQPQAIEAIVPTYLYRYRKTGQYQAQRQRRLAGLTTGSARPADSIL